MADNNIKEETHLSIMDLLMNIYTPMQRGVSHSALVPQLQTPVPPRSEMLDWLSEKHPSPLPVDFMLGSAHGDTKGRLEDRRREKGEGRRDLLTPCWILTLHRAPLEDPAAAAGWWPCSSVLNSVLPTSFPYLDP